MKFREGFVSNSSTTSFFIYGLSFDSDAEIMEKVKANMSDEIRQIVLDKNNKLAQESKYSKHYDTFDAYVNSSEDCCSDFFYDLTRVIENLVFEENPYEGTAYIGVCSSDIKDDETGAEFKERTKVLLRSILGDDVDGFAYLKGAWRNG